jgi:hypothetical protein
MYLRLLLAGLLAFAGTVVSTSHFAIAFEQDLRTHCATVGNDDALIPLPRNLVPAARRLFDLPPDTPEASVQASTPVRCMGGKIWLCNYGANLICGKADKSRVSAGAETYCRQNPGSDSVPMSATGHATIFDWKCAGKEARVSGQIAKVDARGFIRDNWKRLD